MIKGETLLKSKDFNKLTVYYYQSGLLHVLIKKGESINKSDVEECLKFIDKLPNKRFLNLFDFKEGSNVSDDVRRWASSPDGNKLTIADAIVIKGLSQRMIGNFYVNFHKPVKPTRLFSSTQRAVTWLLQQKIAVTANQ